MKYLKIPNGFLEDIGLLSDAEVGRLFSAMLHYAETGEEKRLKGNEKYVWQITKRLVTVVDTSKNGCKKENHWNWKGGVTPQNQVGRSNTEYARWRKSVFERDNYTCRICGKRGGNLNAHHIKPWAEYKDCRYDFDNGVTLCFDCHRNIHGRNK